MKILLSIFMLLATANSCNSSKKAIETNKKMQEVLLGTYYVTQLGDTDVSSYKITINFDDTEKKVTGFAGCNSFFGTYTLENNTLTFGNIASSKKLCPGTISQTERQFLKALNSVNAFSIKDNLISFSENDDILITGTNTIITSNKSSVVTNDIEYKTSVKYTTTTRGSYDFISISKSNILLSKDKGLQNILKYNTDSKDWEAIQKLIKGLDVETIKDLIPPSKNYQLDGAQHANLAVIIGDIEYMTPTFDHGNPPEAIEVLVNKVLSIKENTAKN
ncbi:META domain-containing protein [Winogradskyella litoriviva]|uniref:META domain-containing protein n=1 Tax=Winogradskyella litoriviva TaxID=1220182 RepID=A0ABX2E247_9FLAO|nr:META domain-containing protein [Winogradskyella litoriviva]NRD22314.1 META domain-containing protein [Winogradskyella litoriviva]